VITPIFAVTTRGLEAISAAEMRASGLAVSRIGYRRIESACDDLGVVSRLRTVDDVFVQVGRWDEIGHTRDELKRMTTLSAALDLEPALVAVRQIRPLPCPIHFSVTANFVGRRNYTAPEIKVAVAQGIMQQRGEWLYADDDTQAAINLRVFMEHTEATIGGRALSQPLHRRPYKQQHTPGSLKPTVAAAMLYLAGAEAGMRLVDPFCGAGTIPLEAALMGVSAMGGDMDAEVLSAALANTPDTEVPPRFLRWDATRLPLASGAVDVVVTNPPWGRQIEVDASLQSLYRRAFDELRRVVRPGGQIVVLTTYPELIDATPAEQIEISLYGQTPVIVRYVG
jgi:tRNA (guanine6-N2)-methyltransferase